ncbi:MAG: exosortase/archaeosortase family protein [Candidatus Micrarchaeota archaeon]|nr:exosortase/archaeosortase family protein [Candidatus Micrarchaeota archaeon]
MRYNARFAALLLIAATVLLLSTSLFITQTAISDTDPSTYVIVPILMLPLLVLFSMKSKPVPNVDKRSAFVGIAAFAAFIALTLVLRVYFTFFFISFRVDMLLMPLALAASICLLFGISNISKFRVALVYSLLASPMVLYPILVQAGAFTQANSALVYSVIRLFISGVSYTAPITISANGYSIGIGQACVSIGTFIALALFLVPVAYLYNGTVKRRALWAASGVALLFVLNLARMLGISLVWLGYGPNTTAALIHTFIGVLLFYIDIVVMIMIAGFFGLAIEKLSRSRRKPRAEHVSPWPAAAAFAFCAVYVLITLNYSSAFLISPMAFQNSQPFNYSNPLVSGGIQSLINRGNFTSLAVATPNGTSVFITLTNASISSIEPVLLFVTVPNSNVVSGLQSHNIVLGEMRFFNTKGAEEQAIDLISNGTEFLVYNTNLELAVSNSSEMPTGVYLIIPAAELPGSNASCGSYDPLYSWLYNLPTRSGYNQTVRQNLLDAQCFSYNLFWK